LVASADRKIFYYENFPYHAGISREKQRAYYSYIQDFGLCVLVASFGREIHEITREPRPALGWHNQK